MGYTFMTPLAAITKYHDHYTMTMRMFGRSKLVYKSFDKPIDTNIWALSFCSLFILGGEFLFLSLTLLPLGLIGYVLYVPSKLLLAFSHLLMLNKSTAKECLSGIFSVTVTGSDVFN